MTSAAAVPARPRARHRFAARDLERLSGDKVAGDWLLLGTAEPIRKEMIEAGNEAAAGKRETLQERVKTNVSHQSRTLKGSQTFTIKWFKMILAQLLRKPVDLFPSKSGLFI